MTATWPVKSVKVVGALLASLLLNIPIDVYRNGGSDVVPLGVAIAVPFVGVAILEFFRNAGRFQSFFAERSFDGMLLRTFMCMLPSFVVNTLAAVSPILYSGGLQIGMTVGLLTGARFATLDRPQVADRRYWTTSGFVFATFVGVAVYVLDGHSATALIHASEAVLVYLGGLWLGLMLGNSVNHWIVALQPTFRLVKRMGRTLVAFAAGYLAIVSIFSTIFAAVWRLKGAESFVGLPSSPTIPTFMYFSLVTATTVGYGDIVPKSPLARSLTGIELITSLAWTLVVFAALAVRFASEAESAEPPKGDLLQ